MNATSLKFQMPRKTVPNSCSISSKRQKSTPFRSSEKLCVVFSARHKQSWSIKETGCSRPKNSGDQFTNKTWIDFVATVAPQLSFHSMIFMFMLSEYPVLYCTSNSRNNKLSTGDTKYLYFHPNPHCHRCMAKDISLATLNDFWLPLYKVTMCSRYNAQWDT